MSILTDSLSALVNRVDVRTAWGPTISLDQPFSPSPPGDDNAFTKTMQPAIDIYSSASSAPLTFAPYGDPGESKWPFLVAGLGFGVGWLAYRAFGRRTR